MRTLLLFLIIALLLPSPASMQGKDKRQEVIDFWNDTYVYYVYDMKSILVDDYQYPEEGLVTYYEFAIEISELDFPEDTTFRTLHLIYMDSTNNLAMVFYVLHSLEIYGGTSEMSKILLDRGHQTLDQYDNWVKAICEYIPEVCTERGKFIVPPDRKEG